MNRLLLGFVATLGLSALIFTAQTSAAVAEIAPLEDATKEMVEGNPDAPVSIIEYSSLGCPHCANFHFNTYPEVRKNYVDTGKVKLIYRDFPLGTPALAASMIARCAGSKRYFGMIEIFFSSQKQWGGAENPLEALKKVARFGGMSGQDVDACLQNQPLLSHIRDKAAVGQKDHGINATPSFIIGEDKISGGLPYEEFKVYLDKALEKAK